MSKHGAALLAAAAFLVVIGVSGFGAGGHALALAPTELRTDALAGTAFTYQGRLTDGGVAADGVYDFRLQLYDQATGGTASGEVVIDDLTVSGGLFAAALDFGAGAFSGDARWLALAVRPGADTGAYTDLSPRQPLTPAPYALALPGMRTIQGGDSPSVVGGYGGNIVDNGVVGATIAGGGKAGDENRVTADHGSVGGGRANVVSGGANGSNATIGGGGRNSTNGENATVAGGWDNAAWEYAATIGGGANNRAN
ncbi:MAG: hypothetical protein ACE5EL_08630, partial [Anaerolineae bacterium]